MGINPNFGDGTPVLQIQPHFGPSQRDGESSLVSARDVHPRNVAPTPQKVGKREWRSLSPPLPQTLAALSPLAGPARTTRAPRVLLRENVEKAAKIPAREGPGSLGSSSTGPLECSFCSSEDGKPQGLSGEAIPLGTISLLLPPIPETSDLVTFQ